MDREELRGTLMRLLQEEMGEEYPTLADDIELKDGLNLDSVDVVGLVMRIERELRVRLSTPDLEEIRTVRDMLDLLVAKLSAPERNRADHAARGADGTPESTAA